MEWIPMVEPVDEAIVPNLTDLEIKKVKQFEKKILRAPFDREKKVLELEILYIYRNALKRHAKKAPKTLWDWLNEDEKRELKRIIEKADSARSFKKSLHYQVAGHRIYFESICRQTEFRFKEELEKYLGILEKCETSREVEITTSIIRDLFAEA